MWHVTPKVCNAQMVDVKWRCEKKCGVGVFFFFQAEDGIRDLVRSRGLGDVYKRQVTYKSITYNACQA